MDTDKDLFEDAQFLQASGYVDELKIILAIMQRWRDDMATVFGIMREIAKQNGATEEKLGLDLDVRQPSRLDS